MLADVIRSLILDERARDRHFLDDVDVDAYVAKLTERAEMVTDWTTGRCRGVVAFYCNDETTRQAFITLVLVDSRDRGAGIGPALVRCVLDLARRRGFTSCRLEVAQQNDVAQAMYLSLGFRVVETRARTHLLEIGL